jgi:hypothetical protein
MNIPILRLFLEGWRFRRIIYFGETKIIKKGEPMGDKNEFKKIASIT